MLKLLTFKPRLVDVKRLADKAGALRRIVVRPQAQRHHLIPSRLAVDSELALKAYRWRRWSCGKYCSMNAFKLIVFYQADNIFVVQRVGCNLFKS